MPRAKTHNARIVCLGLRGLSLEGDNPLEEGDNPLEGKLFLVDVIFVLLYRTKYKTQKGEKLQTPEILDKYSSSALLN